MAATNNNNKKIIGHEMWIYTEMILLCEKKKTWYQVTLIVWYKSQLSDNVQVLEVKMIFIFSVWELIFGDTTFKDCSFPH